MPLVLLLLLGGAVAAGIALSRKGGSAEVDAAMGDKLAKYCTKGPGGEWVFKPDVALGITRTLAGQLYSYVSQSDPTRVIIRPDPTGAPPAADSSALGWARTQNAQMTIMAPVYWPSPRPPTGTCKPRLRARKRSSRSFTAFSLTRARSRETSRRLE